MTGMIRKATLLVAVGLVAASAAMAGVPSPANSVISKSLTLPLTATQYIDVVGTNGAVADPFGSFYVTVRDIGNNVLPGLPVTVNFVNASDIRLCTTLVPAGQTNACNIATVVTNALGQAKFTIAGAARNSGGLLTGGGALAVVVAADGFVLGNVTAAVYDLNGAVGSPGLTSLDASAFSVDNGLFGGAGNPAYKGRCDYTHDGMISSLDASYASVLRGLGTSALGGTYCP
jgi:hypothetical protein